MEDEVQKYDNKPNNQHQFPREYDGERADRRYSNSREEPAKEPYQPSGTQEVEGGKCQKQNNKHFFYLLSFFL